MKDFLIKKMTKDLTKMSDYFTSARHALEWGRATHIRTMGHETGLSEAISDIIDKIRELNQSTYNIAMNGASFGNKHICLNDVQLIINRVRYLGDDVGLDKIMGDIDYTRNIIYDLTKAYNHMFTVMCYTPIDETVPTTLIRHED